MHSQASVTRTTTYLPTGTRAHARTPGDIARDRLSITTRADDLSVRSCCVCARTPTSTCRQSRKVCPNSLGSSSFAEIATPPLMPPPLTPRIGRSLATRTPSTFRSSSRGESGGDRKLSSGIRGLRPATASGAILTCAGGFACLVGLQHLAIIAKCWDLRTCAGTERVSDGSRRRGVARSKRMRCARRAVPEGAPEIAVVEIDGPRTTLDHHARSARAAR